MRVRKKELEAIVELLSSPAESVDDLAKEVWTAIDTMRREHELFVVGVNYVGVGQFLFGCYDTHNAAMKDIEGRGKLRALRLGDSGKVFKILSPSDVFADAQGEQGILEFR